MATSKKTTDTVVIDPVQEPKQDSQIDFLRSKTAKTVAIAAGLVLVLVAGWFAYHSFVKQPKEEKANEMVFEAENLFDKMTNSGFNKDSVNLVLNGGALEGRQVIGVLKVISKYDGTMAANRANYIAGASYLNIGSFDKAVKHLKEFKGNGADQVQIQANILIAQAYAELKKTGDALDYFKKAATVNPKDEIFTGNALMLGGNYALFIGKKDEAKDLYTKLKNEYPKNPNVMNGEVDKLLASMGYID